MIEFFPDMKTFIKLGPITIAWYAVFIMTGAFTAYYLSLRNLKKMGYEKEDAENLFYGALLFGVLGARIWYVMFFDISYYLQDPIRIIRFQDGGLAIHGGLIGGIAFAYYYAKKRGFNFMHWTDAVVPNVLVAQAIGRWGNFMNQEAFGGIVEESHFRFLPTFIKNNMYIDGAYRAPTFLYESVLNIIGWILITQLLKKSKDRKRGQQTFAYLIWYGVVRFIIEAMRTDALMVNLGFTELRIAQIASIIFVVVGLLGYYGNFRKLYPSPKPTLIFDFDGTLADTQELIHKTFVEVFKTHKPDHKLSDEELLSFIGPTLWDSFGKYFPEDRVDDIIAEYRKLNLEIHHEYIKPMDHVIEVLDKLKAEGYRMGVVSSKLRQPVLYGIELLDMEKYFDFVYGFDDYTYPKPDPDGILMSVKENFVDRSSYVYLGDSVSDIVAGRAAGAYTIGYIFDENRKDALIASEPNAIIDDWRDLIEILEGDHEWTYNMM